MNYIPLFKAAVLGLAIFMGLSGCSGTSTELPTMSLSSTSLLENGKWDSIITNTEMGMNLSPQVSWAPVKDAQYYAVYMIDVSAGNWLHWIARDISVTELELGAPLPNSMYIGPYPPSGTHTYQLLVFALKSSPDAYLGSFDNTNPGVATFIKGLDTAKGTSGNIVAMGTLSGTYTLGE